MHISKEFSLAACALFLLSGCVSSTPFRFYGGPEKSDSEVAIIKEGDLGGLFSYRAEIITLNGTDIGGQPRVLHSIVKVLPGTYRIRLQCAGVNGIAYPSFTATVQAGRSYEVHCGDVGGVISILLHGSITEL